MDNADWTAQGDQVQAWCGWSVSTAGDVNGDGYSDVMVGLPGYTNGEGNEGAARLYLGSSTGLNNSYANHDEGNQDRGNLWRRGDHRRRCQRRWLCRRHRRRFDIFKRRVGKGRVYLWLGSVAGISTTNNWYDEGNLAYGFFGSSVATAGDVNGDGYSDILIGAPGRGSNAGTAYAYYGGPDSLEETARWTKDSDQANAHFGQSVASAGDVNADGYTDMIVGAPQWDAGQSEEGGAWIYLGAGAGLETGDPLRGAAPSGRV